MSLPKNFDVNSYRLLNSDLQQLNNEQLINHYLTNGINEGRLYKYNLPNDFNLNSYRNLNIDLKELNDEQLINHYLTNGVNEGRLYKYNLPNDFNSSSYKLLNLDLKDLNNEQLINHYLTNGINEGRLYKYNLPEDFDLHSYRFINNDLKDLNDEQLINHYLTNGINEKRLYKYNLPEDFDLQSYRLLNDDLKDLNDKQLISHYLMNGIYENRKYKTDTIFLEIFDINYFNKIECKNIYFDNIKNIKSNFGIAISLYIDDITPEERILRSKKCIKSIILNFYNNLIIIVIDYEITDNYLQYLFDITKLYNNILIVKNKKNEGISKTKNICLKLLEYYNIEYFCLLDDDVEIKNNFEDYIINVFEKTDIPLISNSNIEYNDNIIINDIFLFKNKYFIDSDTHDYYGNLLIINKKNLNIYGYFYIFDYKIGIDHIEFTERYLKNTKFKGLSVNFNNYINNFEVINNKNTLFIHSKDVITEEYNNNLKSFFEIKDKVYYVDFKFDMKEDIIIIRNNLLLNNIFNNDIKLNKYIFIKNNSLNNLIYNEDLVKSKINYIDFILWINLDKDHERKKYMHSILEVLNISNIRISGINGNEYVSNNNLEYNFERVLNNGEIGCTFSHIKAINYCKKLDGKYFMICEDDISFKNILIFNNDLNNIIKEAPDFDILLLYKTYFKNLNNKYEKWSDYYIENPVDHIGGTVCYIITQNAINKFCEKNCFINNKIIINDNQIKIDVADIFIYKQLNTYVYKYNFITTFENNSTIHLNHSEYQNISHEYQKNILIDYIYDL